MDKKHYLLWTGGWDSTFRMIELSFQAVDIYPIYVIDHRRVSKEYELKCMKEIVDMLRDKPATKAVIHDIELIERSKIPEDQEITQAYHLIHEKTRLGSQHEWLARLGKSRPGLEMGTEAGSPETSHILDAIDRFGKLVIVDGCGYLDQKQSTKEGLLVLGWFKFPIITRTERDMLQAVIKWGYEDVMRKIWFCHRPIKGKPCGCCHPCDVKIESNMEWLLPKQAVVRYRMIRVVTSVMGLKVGRRFAEMFHKFSL